MGTAKICTGVALLFAIVGVILKFVAIALPNFVDVHVINDIDDVAEENRIAQVGVYQSVIDTESGDALAAAERGGIPPLKIESPSTEFPLLFPAQEDFLPQVLPINQNAIDLLNGISAGLGTAALQVPLDAVEAVEFENCEQYSDEISQTTQALFQAFQDDALSAVIAGISATGITTLNSGFAGLVGVGPALSGIVGGLFSGGFAVAPACTAAGVELTTLLDDGLANACIQNIVGGATLQNVFFGEFFTELFIGCIASADITTFGECAAAIPGEFLLEDNGIAEDATFGVDALLDLCALPSLACTSKAEFLQAIIAPITVIAEFGDGNAQLAALAEGIATYLFVFAGGFIDADASFTDGVNIFPFAPFAFAAADVGTTPFPQPCEFINIFVGGACITINNYLDQVGGVVAQNDPDLAASLEAFTDIYKECFAEANAGTCPLLFTAGVAVGVFGDGAVEAALVGQLAGFIDEQCEENEVDKAKVSEGQIYVALSAALEIVAVLVLFGAVLTPDGISKFVAPVGAGFAIIGAIFVFTALVTVASAPVYEGVGDEPNGVDFEVIFVAGVVGTLAAIDGALMVVAGIVALIATVIGFMSNGDDEEYEGKKDEVAPVAEEDPEDKL